jgi:outer membrane protein assembly factor BamB
MRALFMLLALAAIGMLVGLILWRNHVSELEEVTQGGLKRLARARDAGEIRQALRDWRRENAQLLSTRQGDWISYVLSRGVMDDPNVRRLLAESAGADYGDRESDWQRWNDARRKVEQGKQPAIPARERIDLSPRWRTPIGLTSFFSTILAIDGRIYGASLGSAFDDATDQADGIVRVDGKTGDAQIIFEPPDKGPRDILGIAYANDLLVAACRNGFVYCTDRDGKLRWKSNSGARLASIPLLFDSNRDGGFDVATVSADGRVSAHRLDSGRHLWTTQIELSPKGFDRDAAVQSPEQAAMRASLAIGAPSSAGGGGLFVATIGGELYVLAPSSGKTTWRGQIGTGILSSPVFGTVTQESGGSFFFGDAAGRLWTTLRTAKSTEARVIGEVDHPYDPRIVASPRTIDGGASPESTDWIVCSAGGATSGGGSVQRLAALGSSWRFTPGGAIWSSPAIADVNGDDRPEIVVVSSNATSAGEWWSRVSIVSDSGHLLRWAWLEAAVECPPVVADVDGDGAMEILVADRSGLLHCIETGRTGPVEWGLAAGDPGNSRNAVNAYSFGQTPFGHQGRWRPR